MSFIAQYSVTAVTVTGQYIKFTGTGRVGNPRGKSKEVYRLDMKLTQVETRHLSRQNQRKDRKSFPRVWAGWQMRRGHLA